MTTFKKGDIVLYGSDPGQRTGCVIDRGPWKTANGDEVYRIIGPCFMTGVCDAAFAGWMELAPTIYSMTKRTWRKRSARDNERIDHEVFYVLPGSVGALASPQGLGWTWQAGSKCGCSESYEAARAAVEELCK